MGVGGFGIACCCVPCCTFTDPFTRDDSDTPGNGWTEGGGADFDIVSNKLSTSGTGTVRQSACEMSGAEHAAVQVIVSAPTDNVFVAVGVETAVDALLDWSTNKVGIGFDFSGVPDCDYTLAAATAYTVKLEYYDPPVSANIVSMYIGGALVARDFGNRPVGKSLLNVTTNPTPSAVTFDDFSLTVERVGDAACITRQACIWPPSSATMPAQLKVSITNATGFGATPCADCASLNNDYYLDKKGTPDANDCATYELDITDVCGVSVLTVNIVVGAGVVTYRVRLAFSTPFGDVYDFTSQCDMAKATLTATGIITKNIDSEECSLDVSIQAA